VSVLLLRKGLNMDISALFSITYGLFILATEDEGQKNACIINTFSQVTQDPVIISITVMKKNLTHDIIKKTGAFSVSILGKHASMKLIERFGYQSGREVDKFADFDCGCFGNNLPLVEAGCIAALRCKVIKSDDFPTHTVFFASVEDAKTLAKDQPMTYAYYRDLKTGKVKQSDDMDSELEPVASPEPKEVWQCMVCHYVYDGDIPFEDLPDDYVCPLCGQPKSVFEKQQL